MSRNPGPDPNSTNNTVLKTKRLELSFGSDQDAKDLLPFVHGEPGRKVTNTLRVHPKRGRWVDAHLYGISPEDLEVGR